MKKINLLAVLLCVCPMMIFGQLKVLPDGKTVAGSGSAGTAQLTVTANNTANANKVGIYGFAGSTTSNSNQTVVGVEGSVLGGYGNQGAKIGVRGFSGSGPDGKHYGVFGALSSGGMSGAAIFGTAWSPSTGNSPIALSGAYAGYFKGQVRITDLLDVVQATWSSDYRFKQNITELDKQKTFANVLNLNPVEYNFKQRYLDGIDSLGNSIQVEYFDEKSQLFQKKHYGLIAQEVQRLYPDLVYEDNEGYLSIDYIGIIPLLIQSLKEQNARIEQLEKVNTVMLGARTMQMTEITDTYSDQPAALFQNAPNPFSQSTEIKYYLPTSVNTAFLCIYDLNGKQQKQIRLSERGDGSQIISGAEFSAGIYLYTLIADGKEIDVKRMILTE